MLVDAMTRQTIWSPDGSVYRGKLQPEIAEPSLAILRRDLKKMQKHRCTSFIRKPYFDLNELEIVTDVNRQAKAAVAVLVIRLVANETNARVFLNQSMFDSEVAKGEALNLCDGLGNRGFGN